MTSPYEWKIFEQDNKTNQIKQCTGTYIIRVLVKFVYGENAKITNRNQMSFRKWASWSLTLLFCLVLSYKNKRCTFYDVTFLN